MPEQVALSNDMVIVLGILALAVFLFAFEIVRVDVAAVFIMVVLGLTRLVPGAALFSGFSSNAVISIIAIMIIGAGLDRSGLMARLAGRILRLGGSTERRIIPIVSATVGVLSSFMQNVGAAALFLPVVSRISTSTGIPLARLLMPMGFCAILGGTMTMVGSSPLILLNDLLENANSNLPAGVPPMAGFGLFAVTPVGVVLVAMGIGYFVLAGRWILPATRGSTPQPGVTSQYLQKVYGVEGQIYEAVIRTGSPLADLTVRDMEALPNAPYVVAVRDSAALRLAPPGDLSIAAGATIALMGAEQQVLEYAKRYRLELKRALEVFVESLNPVRSGIAEVVLPPGSSLIGKNIVEIELRKHYGTSLLAIYRDEAAIRTNLRDVALHAGDTLVVHSTWSDLQAVAEDRNFVVITDFPRVDRTRPEKIPWAVSFFALALALVLFTDLPLSLALFTGAIGMIVTRVLSIDEAYRAVSWQTVFLLASLIPLGIAVETSGTATWVAFQVLSLFGGLPAWMLQTAIAVLATFFTLVMSNVAATVLLVPLAVSIALGIGSDPAMFALTVALATSNSFLLPTHQVNALIMGPGGYRVTDFMRAGGVMTVLFLAVLIGMLNVVF